MDQGIEILALSETWFIENPLPCALTSLIRPSFNIIKTSDFLADVSVTQS